VKIPVGVMVALGADWQAGILTDERPESSYGLPVVVVEGEQVARGMGEVAWLDPAVTLHHEPLKIMAGSIADCYRLNGGDVEAFLRRTLAAGFRILGLQDGVAVRVW